MRILSAILLASIWSTGYAADDCTGIDEDSKRLACYDMKYRPVSTVEQASSWEVSETFSKIDDSKTIVLHSTSKEVVANQYGGGDTADFYIRCAEGATSLYFVLAGNFLADSEEYGQVTYRVDNQKARTYSFSSSTDNKALGQWGGQYAIPVVKQLFDAQQLVVRITPYNESPVTVTFPVSGLRQAIAPLQLACKWK
ncbi:type VI secretion system-associated protein TagO [Pseudomonas sp. NPDC087342]|uniref:type VI secretion system-associated protein TagO n=1 Tax=Pseudomonas sp. NPDC087342 TaxID=3364437 RepID=UPI0037FC5279